MITIPFLFLLEYMPRAISTIFSQQAFPTFNLRMRKCFQHLAVHRENRSKGEYEEENTDNRVGKR